MSPSSSIGRFRVVSKLGKAAWAPSTAPSTPAFANELGHTWPQFPPDGRHFLHLSRSPGGTSVVARNRDAKQPRHLGNGPFDRGTRPHDQRWPGFQCPPEWSPDSQRLVYSPGAGGIVQIELLSGKITTLSKEDLVVNAWTPDARSLLCTNRGGTRVLPGAAEPGARMQTAFHPLPPGELPPLARWTVCRPRVRRVGPE
jgi:hypothetical protein